MSSTFVAFAGSDLTALRSSQLCSRSRRDHFKESTKQRRSQPLSRAQLQRGRFRLVFEDAAEAPGRVTQLRLATLSAAELWATAMRLAHLHIGRLIPYTHASHLQEILIQRQFRYKDLVRSSLNPSHKDITAGQPPDPTILTFSTTPTYTVGRRYLSRNPLPQSQIDYLTGVDAPAESSSSPRGVGGPVATFHASARGGDVTYHGPGQVTAYTVVDLRRHGITPRCYVRLLERSVIASCARLGVPNTATSADYPGVWITGTDRKVCAVGVQIRRGVTGHGVGLNVVDTRLSEEDERGAMVAQTESSADNSDKGGTVGRRGEGGGHGYLSWGFSRIVACGLEGKSVTWLAREQEQQRREQEVQKGTAATGTQTTSTSIISPLTVELAARMFVEEFARGLNDNRVSEPVPEIYELAEDDVLAGAQ